MTCKKIVFTVLLIILFISGTGCWDRRELESLGLIQTLGLDLGPQGRGVTITTMIAIPPKLKGGGGEGGGGGGSESGVFVLSMNAPTIYEGFNLINTTVNREMTLLQNSALLIGEDLARQGIRRWVDTLLRYREMRRTLLIFICRGRAADFMNVKTKLEQNPAEYFLDLERLSKRTGMFPMMSLNDFLDSYEAYAQENYAPLLIKFQRHDSDEFEKAKQSNSKPEEAKNAGGGDSKEAPSTGNQPKPEPKDVRLAGVAVFKKDKMVGTLDIYETQVLQLLTNKFQEAFLTIRDPLKKGNLIAYRLLATTPAQIKYMHQNNRDIFRVKLKLEADILSIQSGIDYTKPEKEKLLGKYIASEWQKRIDKTVQKAQQQYQSDVFGFGIKVRDTVLTSKEWNQIHWPEKFKDADIRTKVHVDLRRIGVQFAPPQPR